MKILLILLLTIYVVNSKKLNEVWYLLIAGENGHQSFGEYTCFKN